MPVDGGPSIPWALIEPFERQAKANHGQTLERLAERGGLSPGEALAIVEGKRWGEVSEVGADLKLYAWIRAREVCPHEGCPKCSVATVASTDNLVRKIIIQSPFSEALLAVLQAARNALTSGVALYLPELREAVKEWDALVAPSDTSGALHWCQTALSFTLEDGLRDDPLNVGSWKDCCRANAAAILAAYPAKINDSSDANPIIRPIAADAPADAPPVCTKCDCAHPPDKPCAFGAGGG